MKTRVTVSLSKELLQEAERRGSSTAKRNRSALLEEALQLLVRARREQEIEASLDAYYGEMTGDERGEEAAMVKAFHCSQRRSSLDAEGRSRSRHRP